MTRQCLAVLHAVQSSDGHQTAEEIYLSAKREIPSIARGTVYRNLHLLAEEGKIRKVSCAEGPDKYDRNLQIHGHLVCPVCGRISDVGDEKLLKTMKNLAGGEIDGFDLSIYKTCEDCKSK